MNEDEKQATLVFAALLGLTVLTVGLYFLPFTRLPGIAAALAVASVKASLIGWFFMELRKADALTLGLVLGGVGAAVVLSVGILPDVGRVLPG